MNLYSLQLVYNLQKSCDRPCLFERGFGRAGITKVVFFQVVGSAQNEKFFYCVVYNIGF